MRKHYLALVLCFICITAFSQAGRQITGTVIASGTKQPLDKVTVTEKGTRNYALTDSLGSFSMVLSTSNATLVFSYIGYQDQEVKAGNSNNIDVQLVINTGDLSEVVVTALGIKRELKSLGYASQQVSSQQITQSKQPNLINALQGKVAGVTISSTGGGPGQSASILIRGINSLDPGKNSQPLFVIDGLPIEAVEYFNKYKFYVRRARQKPASAVPSNSLSSFHSVPAAL